MHRAAPNISWAAIENANLRKINSDLEKIQLRQACGEEDEFADGLIRGYWEEIGSKNQAGSILDIDYFPGTDEFWVWAAGGSLWKRSRTQNDWRVINQKQRFDRGLFKRIRFGRQFRLLAFSGNKLHYSDNEGIDWIRSQSSFYERGADHYFSHPVVSEGGSNYIAFLGKGSYWDNLSLLVSTNNGETVKSIETFNTINPDEFDLVTIPNTDQMLLIRKSLGIGFLQIYSINFENGSLSLLNPDSKFKAGGNALDLQVYFGDQGPQLFYYKMEPASTAPTLYLSNSEFTDWEEIGLMPATPWESTFYHSPLYPDHLFFGEVEAFRSFDLGATWTKANDWWDYYNDVHGALHADIMDIQAFSTTEGLPFYLLSNHGGISISYDGLETFENIGRSDLLVSQYYSVRTNPSNPEMVYAGSQDQGIQKSNTPFREDGSQNFLQTISGDYGHLHYTNSGKHLWASYPGGGVYYIHNTDFGNVVATYDLESSDETVWLAPLHASPYTNDDAVYMAGGSVTGGDGSYLIRMEYESGQIKATQDQPDFLFEAIDGTISAIEFAPTDSNYWYVATTNGRFFYSQDEGKNWSQTLNFLPRGNYLYGQAVEVSKYNPKHIYLGGSGYSNPAIFFSEDGGETFIDRVQGLPSTLVYDLAFNDDETLLFAATEAGPYVFVLRDQQWYPLHNGCNPIQTYWSVEFVPQTEIVRFGTYGRGIWDFQITGTLLTSTDEVEKSNIKVEVFPNPMADQFSIRLKNMEGHYNLLNSKGQIIQNDRLQLGINSVNVSTLPKGIYFIQIVTKEGAVTKKILK
ncbi:MAG: T9SS type A sorting domain-containing protein, partial [Bacteroidota bacterium]